jgi:hypothetical protein
MMKPACDADNPFDKIVFYSFNRLFLNGAALIVQKVRPLPRTRYALVTENAGPSSGTGRKLIAEGVRAANRMHLHFTSSAGN